MIDLDTIIKVLDALTIMAGIGLSISYLLQIVHMWIRKSSDDINIFTFIIIAMCVGIFIGNSIAHQNWALTIANTISLIFCLGVVVVAALYKIPHHHKEKQNEKE